ncbi:uncharacterized protein NPIL_497901, partial [Nephila pilipes]
GMDIFSYIGGLMGCWLGISVWACTGIAETTFWTILHFLKQFTKKSRHSPPDRKQLLFKRNHHNILHKPDNSYANYSGSSSNIEIVGVYRTFERFDSLRSLRYTDFYGGGDSKKFNVVQDIYGNESMRKLQCIGHVRKRVGVHF